MGVTIESKNCSIDLGYGGFRNLRLKVAELAADDIFDHYKKSTDGMRLYDEDERKAFYDEYNKETTALDLKYEGKMSDVFDFLYASDCGAKMDTEHCRSIYSVICNYDDNVKYGYAGRKDCAMFKDFKNIVKNGLDTGEGIEWW